MKVARVGLAVACVALGFGTTVWGTASGRGAAKALIAYSTHGHIYTLAADGSGQRRLTVGAGLQHFREDFSPAWSPNAAKIAFVREARVAQQDSTRIHVMRADGTREHLLVANKPGQFDSSPAYSPDGSKIAFTREIQSAHGLVNEVLVAAADGADPKAVVLRRWRQGDGLKRLRFFIDPVWSPDDGQLLFTESRFGRTAHHDLTFARSLHLVAATGGDVALVAQHAAAPSFSPNGKHMVYVSEADHNGTTCYEECSINGELYVSHADGTAARRLTKTTLDEEAPDWSADGREIVFQRSGKEMTDRLFSVPPSGECAPVLLTPGKHTYADSPAWQPDPSLSSDPGVCGTPSH